MNSYKRSASRLDTDYYDDYSPERWAERDSDDADQYIASQQDFDKRHLEYGLLPEPTIYQLTGCNWVVMSDMQTPKLVREIVDHRLPRLRVSSMTLSEATQYINESWDLCDRGFVQIENHVIWQWWDNPTRDESLEEIKRYLSNSIAPAKKHKSLEGDE